MNDRVFIDILISRKKDYEARLKRVKGVIYSPGNRLAAVLNEEDSWTETSILDNHIAELKNLEDSLDKLNLAIKRFKNGNLGFCSKCGKKIEIMRMKLMPYTDMCSACAKLSNFKSPQT